MGMEVLAIDHLENLYFRSGDVVCGIFPLHLAARICATGAEVHAITVEVPVELRGVKMDIDTMLQLGAKLVQFDVRRVTKLGWDDIRCEAPRFFPT